MPSSRLVKGLVLASSCLLVGGYLLYAGGRSLMSGSKSARVFADEPPTTQPSRTMIYSSKSGRIVDQHDSGPNVLYGEGHAEFGTAPTTSPATRRLIMGGSKSKQVFQPEDLQPANAPATQPARTMLRGSKSAPIFEPQGK